MTRASRIGVDAEAVGVSRGGGGSELAAGDASEDVLGPTLNGGGVAIAGDSVEATAGDVVTDTGGELGPNSLATGSGCNELGPGSVRTGTSAGNELGPGSVRTGAGNELGPGSFKLSC